MKSCVKSILDVNQERSTQPFAIDADGLMKK